MCSLYVALHPCTAGAADNQGLSVDALALVSTPSPGDARELKITTRFPFYTEKRKCTVYFIPFTILENLNFFHVNS